MTHVNNRAVDKLGPILLPAVESVSDATAEHTSLSPERATPPAAPVFLLHGAEDNVIPSVETVLLTNYLQRQNRSARRAERPHHARRSGQERGRDRSVAAGGVLEGADGEVERQSSSKLSKFISSQFEIAARSAEVRQFCTAHFELVTLNFELTDLIYVAHSPSITSGMNALRLAEIHVVFGAAARRT